jgi:RNA polymerase sigma factor (sigma-70 family)
MATKDHAVLRVIRSLANKRGDDEASDRELLARFVAQRDEDAFTTLVRRHGPMVMAVGLRVLHHHQDAEDVGQATFLLLARKARTTVWRDTIANWLYEVAHNLARKARDAAGRRSVHENRVPLKAPTDALSDLTLRDLQAVLDRELARLPEKYRTPIILCCLEGKARDEAARCLGWPLRLIKSRLEEGRELLRRRLAGRGLLLSVALAGHALLSETARAAVPSLLVRATSRAALQALTGRIDSVVVSPTVATLVNGGLQTMFLAKLKVISIALLLVCLSGVGMAALTLQAAQTQSRHEGRPPRAPTAGAPQATKGGSVGGNGATHDAKPAWREILTMKHEHALTTIACSSDWTVGGDEGGNLFAWNTKTGKNRTTLLKGAKNQLNTTIDRLQFTADEKDQYTPDGKSLYVILGGRRGIARFFVKDKKFEGGHGYGADADTYLGVSADAEISLEFIRGGRGVYLRRNAYVFKMGRFEVRPNFDPNHHEYVEYKAKVSHALVSAGEKWLAAATKDGTLHIHDRASLKETHTITSGRKGVAITDIQFSADGQRIAVARDDTLAKVYDTAKGEEVTTLKGHSGIVFTVAFSPDGKKLVTGGDDNTARVFDGATGKALASLEGHTDSVRCAAFDPSGEILVTGSADKTVKLWKFR